MPTNKEPTSENLEKVYLAIDLLGKEEDHLEISKRKFVCLESFSNKLIVKGYDHRRFLAKDENIKIHLALYVKGDKQKELLDKFNSKLTELVDFNDDEKIVEFREFVKKLSKNVNGFDHYKELIEAYDKETGLHVDTVLKELKSLIERAASYVNRSVGLADSSKELSKLLAEWHKGINVGKVSISDLLEKFNFLQPVVNSEIDRLNNEDNLKKLQKNLDNLRVDIEAKCPENSLFSGEIHKKRFELNEDIEGLAKLIEITIKKNSIAKTSVNIQPLQTKYKELEEGFLPLKEEIEKLPKPIEKNTQNIVDEKDRQMKSAMLETYFKKIVPALKAIEDHKGVTKSTDKKAILETIITDVNQLQGEIAGSVKEAIQAKAKSIVSYIDENYLNLATARGFFAPKGTSGYLVESLKLILNNMFLLQEPSSELTAVAQPRP